MQPVSTVAPMTSRNIPGTARARQRTVVAPAARCTTASAMNVSPVAPEKYSGLLSSHSAAPSAGPVLVAAVQRIFSRPAAMLANAPVKGR
eukprot:6358849-Prymnesium_polylepis.2